MESTVGEQYHLEMIKKLPRAKGVSLGSELEKRAEEHPQHPAVVFGKKSLTYQELNRLANRYAHYFAAQGFKKGDVAALLMSNRPEFLIIVSGLSKLGVQTALINSEVRGEVLAHGINIVEPRAVIIGGEYLSLYQTIEERVRLRSPGRLFVETDNKKIKLGDDYENINNELYEANTENPLFTKEINSDDVLAYLYTSGNFGPRKAVPILHQRFLLVGHNSGAFCRLGPDDIQYVAVPLYLNSGFNGCFGGMIVTGSTMVLKERFSAGHFWQEIRDNRVTYFAGVGEMFRYLYSQPEKTDDADNPLEVVVCNGLAGNLMEPFKRRFGIKHMIETYGATAGVGTFVNYEEIPGMCGNLSLNGVRQGEIVKCDYNTGEIKRDQQGWAETCKPGEIGVLLGEINEWNVFTGYVNETEATENRLVKNVFREGDCYYNTLDLMQLHEGGYISFVDRLGDTYRWKGNTVSAQQVADVITKFFGPIEDVTVYGVKIPEMEGRCGMAAIKLLEGEKLDLSKLITYINNRMPEYARPVFLRIVSDLRGADILDDINAELKSEGYSLALVNDPMYYLDPDQDRYLPLTKEVYEAVQENMIPF